MNDATPTPGDQPELRSRTVFFLPLCAGGETFIAVDHVYEPEGTTCCDDCGGPSHDPGMGTLTVSDGDALVTVPLSPATLLLLANRFTRTANLILESEEDVPDVEREAARLTGGAA